jgi:hypothetical protein
VVDVGRLRQLEQQARGHRPPHALSLQRAKAAPSSRAITQAMQGLGMQGGKFAVQLDKLEEPTAAWMACSFWWPATRRHTAIGKVARAASFPAVAGDCRHHQPAGPGRHLIFDEWTPAWAAPWPRPWAS